MIILPPRPGLLDIAPYKGGESRLPGRSQVIKLSSNESAWGPSPLAVEAIAAALPDAHRYPDGHCTALRAALAARENLDADRIVCGAGSF
jgi:histidinol-phosphate aminotransferase